MAEPTLSIVDHELPYETHNEYDVFFYSDQIQTLVTHDADKVASWLSETEAINQSRLHHLIVGLDVEWRPSYSRHQNPVATLQLAVGRRCLIFQILRCPTPLPEKLSVFLGDKNYTFVGVGIKEDLEKLAEDYSLEVGGNVVDLRDLAADRCGRRDLKNAGLKKLAQDVLGKEVAKPKSVTMSRWDNPWLVLNQVKYACVDAFISFEIGRCLNAA